MNSLASCGRLVFSILAPPLIGSFIFAAALVIQDAFFEPEAELTGFLSVWFGAAISTYTFLALQTIAAALIMELEIRPRVTNKRGIVIAWAVLGGLSGASLFSISLTLIGIATGLIIGLCLAPYANPGTPT